MKMEKKRKPLIFKYKPQSNFCFIRKINQNFESQFMKFNVRKKVGNDGKS